MTSHMRLVPAGHLRIARRRPLRRPAREAVTIEQPVTPMTYFGEMAGTAWRHGGELAVGVACAIALTGVAHVTLPERALVVLPAALAAVLLFEAGAAAWRLHRRQGIALATTRMLLDLNAADRAELERHLHARYRRREARIHERNEARLDRLTGEIDILQTEVTERSHRRMAM